ncbi:hypothetical protein KJ359_005438 [Pestalotiopsis sp. 9143b]|nr:hypothetical protein KJ359_005438 [Pestalotiopsis sp. 9143b]
MSSEVDIDASAIPKSNQQIAELLVCNGIQAPITNCGGSLAKTTSTSGTAKWTLTAPSGATLNFFKGTWEECANAARAACPNQTYKGTCLGGVTSGEGFVFELSEA